MRLGTCVCLGVTGNKLHWTCVVSDYADKSLKKHLEEAGGDRIVVNESQIVTNQLPMSRDSLPENISFSCRPMQAAPPSTAYMNWNNSMVPMPAKALIVGTSRSQYGCECSQHKTCGIQLEVGQNIVVFGPNIKHLTEGIYRIG